jgi:hypothetical protein
MEPETVHLPFVLQFANVQPALLGTTNS